MHNACTKFVHQHCTKNRSLNLSLNSVNECKCQLLLHFLSITLTFFVNHYARLLLNHDSGQLTIRAVILSVGSEGFFGSLVETKKNPKNASRHYRKSPEERDFLKSQPIPAAHSQQAEKKLRQRRKISVVTHWVVFYLSFLPPACSKN